MAYRFNVMVRLWFDGSVLHDHQDTRLNRFRRRCRPRAPGPGRTHRLEPEPGQVAATAAGPSGRDACRWHFSAMASLEPLLQAIRRRTERPTARWSKARGPWRGPRGPGLSDGRR